MHDVKVDIGADNLKLYGKLYASAADIGIALYCVEMILKKKWHGFPWSRRGSIYNQQTVYTTSLVVSYCRPFTKSYGWPSFPEELLQYDDEENELHSELLTMRNQFYAHSDSCKFEFQPISTPAIDTVITTEPFRRISIKDAKRLQQMCFKVRSRISWRMQTLFAHKTRPLKTASK
ncbi:hypothetical protein [Pseudovibrio sp. Alg231-02]|uniref:hypothetical protein n=1 Tax=Pseudovibrio sp. Alg231-02 TaxID=1922223 RepID=UPI000D54DE02|nr:hypothetical protein [Pseudovibrio sp. Alg231-02]